MKLAGHVDSLRELIEAAFDKQFARLGFGKAKQLESDKFTEEVQAKRERFVAMLESHIGETGNYENAREKLIDELTFTLFNRLAAIKVMEAVSLFPPILTKQKEHGDRSFGHKAWLEMNPHMRSEELEGIRDYLKTAFDELGQTLPLYSKAYPYALLPDAISLNDIIDAFNAVEQDAQVGNEIWLSDDVLGWMYESYNNKKKQAHKDSKDKTEYNKVSLQSQVYTPRWVVQFLVENSLGKMYLEMYPNSEIKSRYKIANAPKTQTREPKPLHEVRTIDPACGSGNFLLYAFDFYYELYLDQIENYGSGYDEKDIPKLIIENNLHGIDLDDRAIQLAQLGLFIKAKKKRRNIGELNFRVVSSDFYLPDYNEVRHIFEQGAGVERNQQELIEKIWNDLKYAYKFGSLVHIDKQLNAQLHQIESRAKDDLFASAELTEHKDFAENFFVNLTKAVEQYARTESNTFLTSKTRDAITFLELLTTEYDVATANPPYTDSADFGPDLKRFLEGNYKDQYKFSINLYASFIKRCCDLTTADGKVAMVHPPTFMYIKTFEDVRKYILNNSRIELFVEWGFLGMFNPKVRVDSSMYVLSKEENVNLSTFIKLNHIYEGVRYNSFIQSFDDVIYSKNNKNVFNIDQQKLKLIRSYPFIYWTSDSLRERFKSQTIENIGSAKPGLQTGSNERFLRYWWEINKSTFSQNYGDHKKWVNYAKGGDYNKWAGNLWLKVNWDNDGYEIINFFDSKGKQKSRPQNRNHYFQEGITYSATGGKPSFRILPQNSIFDVGGASIFLDKGQSIYYAIALLNSRVTHYILDCLNPTSNIQKGDIDRLLYFEDKSITKDVESLSKCCIKLRQEILAYSLIEESYSKSPLVFQSKDSFAKSVKKYFGYENLLYSLILVIEALIDDLIIKSFNFNGFDKALIESKGGPSIGTLAIDGEAKIEFVENIKKFNLPTIVLEFIESLGSLSIEQVEIDFISNEFSRLYQDTYNLESFCRQQDRQNAKFKNINPINVWYWFNNNSVIPKQRMNTLAMEFLADMIREILIEDDDGIIPLVPNAGEKVMLERIEGKFLEKGFSSAQYSNFDTVLGQPIHEYLNKYFFKEFSDHLNLFQYLPKTPFIWHLTSGPEQGFDCYIIIYKWSRDNLLRLRSVYIENRERALMNRQSDIANNESAETQNEKEKIFKQLKEIEAFKKKIDELLAEGYNPILDDGVGKNIAPLQKKKMLPYDVLNEGQLKKYLNADW